MKFVCDQCNTRYTIADEKVRGKLLKIRCKSCGNVIEVRDPSEAQDAPATTRAASLAASPASNAVPSASVTAAAARTFKTPMASSAARASTATPAAKAPMASSAARASTASSAARAATAAPAARASTAAPATKSPTAAPAARPSTASSAARAATAAPAARASTAAPAAKTLAAAPAAAKPAAAMSPLEDGAAVWYLGDDRGEYGPMTFAELAARVKRGEPGPNAEVWKEGMDDWLSLDDVPELRPFLKRAPPPRPVATVKAAPASPYQKKRGPLEAPGADVPGSTAAKRSAAPHDVADHLAKVPSAAPIREAAESHPRTRATAGLGHQEAPKPAASAAEPPKDPIPVGAPVLAASPAPASPQDPVPELASPPAPAAASDAWPPDKSSPGSRFELDAFSLPISPQPPGAPWVAAEPPVASHVSMRAASDLGSLLVEEQKRARRPILIISLAAVLLAAAAVGLVVWIISSGKKPGDAKAPTKVAEGPDLPRSRGEPRAAMGTERGDQATPPEDGARDLPDLDIDVSLDMTNGVRPQRRRRSQDGSPRQGARGPEATYSSGSGDPLAVPAHRPKFTDISAPSSTDPGGESAPAGSGGAPPNLRSLVNRNQAALKRCYEKAALLDSRLRNPRLSVTVKVTAAGKVTSVRISPNRYEADTLGICVRRSIQTWAFPTFPSDYSWTFGARFQGG